jgi:type II secretory pathway component GspD/PulD (secretin)
VLKSGPDHVRVVYTLKNMPVNDTSSVLTQLFRAEGKLHKSSAATTKGDGGGDVAIVPSVVDNSLVISGSPEAVAEVRELLAQFDKPVAMLLLDVEIGLAPFGETKPAENPDPKAKSPASGQAFRFLEKPAKMETTAHVRLVTLDNQPAFVQLGSRVPRVNSLSALATGGETRSIALDNVGLIVGATPRISSDGVVTMQIDIEQGHVGPENEGIPISVASGKVFRSPRFETTTTQTVVRIPDAQTVIVGSVAQKGKSDKELVVIITPHVIAPEEVKNVR